MKPSIFRIYHISRKQYFYMHIDQFHPWDSKISEEKLKYNKASGSKESFSINTSSSTNFVETNIFVHFCFLPSLSRHSRNAYRSYKLLRVSAIVMLLSSSQQPIWWKYCMHTSQKPLMQLILVH